MSGRIVSRGTYVIGSEYDLIPYDERAKRYVKRQGSGELLVLVAMPERDYTFHKKVRKWLAYVWEQCDQKAHRSLENLKDNMTTVCGFVNVSWDFDGTERIRPKRTNFFDMNNQQEYEDLFEAWQEYVWQNQEKIFGKMTEDQQREITRELETYFSDYSANSNSW